ncbi:MAG: hypothetical protein KF863_21395 [Rubrivivax sp.]|nr:hypothetical protein [Rubrivivax sp.]
MPFELTPSSAASQAFSVAPSPAPAPAFDIVPRAPSPRAPFDGFIEWQDSGTPLGDRMVDVVDFAAPFLLATRGVGQNSHVVTVNFGASAPPPSPPPPPPPQVKSAWWDFEQNDDSLLFLDSTGNENHLTTTLATSAQSISNGVGSGRAHYRGGAGAAFSSRLIYIPRDAQQWLDFGANDSFSIGCFFRARTVMANSWGRMILGRLAGTVIPSGGTAGLGGYYNSAYGLTLFNGALQFYLLTDPDDGTVSTLATAPSTLVAGTWQFLVGVVDLQSMTIRLDINGVTVATQPITRGARNGPGVQGNFCVGHPLGNDSNVETDIDNRQADADFDKAFVSLLPLTVEQSAWLYNSGAGRTFAEARAEGIV